MKRALCVPRRATEYDNPINGFKTYEPVFDENLFASGCMFVDREECEHDEQLKQIIPYVTVKNFNGEFLVYDRPVKNNEERLSAKSSIGFGGHIERVDKPTGFSASQAVVNAAIRELHEELGVTQQDCVLRPVGFINNESDSVGRVHFGISMRAYIDLFVFDFQEREISNPRWMTVEQLSATRGTFETWSQIVIDNISSY